MRAARLVDVAPMQPSPNLPRRQDVLAASKRRGPKRPRIAVLLDYMTLMAGAYEAEIRNAFDRLARQREFDLFLVYGHGLYEPTAPAAAHNSIFELLGLDCVDGIVAVTNSLGTDCGPSRMAQFLKRYEPLPICSLGLELSGVPSVVVDHYTAMVALVEHVVSNHERRRIAFLGGPAGHPDSAIRYQAYLDVLGRHCIDHDLALVRSGDFVSDTARLTVGAMLDEGLGFDAIVAANDKMAMAAIDVLRERGIRVPYNVSVTGFDDIVLARLGSPPMSTVAQPFAAMAENALESLLVQMDGGAPVPKIVLPAQCIVRNSCGCTARARREGPISTAFIGGGAREAMRHHGATIHAALTRILNASGGDGASDAAELLDALRANLDGRDDAFLDTLEAILERTGVQPERYQAFQRGVSYLRERLCPNSSTELEDLWHDARELVTLYGTRGQVRRRNEIDAAYASMLQFAERLASVLDADALKSELEKSLPAVGVHTAWLSRFAPESVDSLEPFVALVDGVPAANLPVRFRAQLLFPAVEQYTQIRRTWLIFPLVCETSNLGVAVFDYAAGNYGYQMVRDQISTALRTIRLHHEVVQKTMLHDRSMQERAASAKRMQALSVLAGGVAHDLNNALGPLVGLPDVMLAELGQLSVPRDATMELHTDLEAIRSATVRASQTIKDLLTLSRQGRTAKEFIDLNRTVVDAVSGAASWPLRQAYPLVQITCIPSEQSLVICGSEAHIGRAVSNLVRNAVEAIDGRGAVSVRTSPCHLAEPVLGYELIAAGDYAVVTVSDDGVGIPAEELTWIFEPFASKKRVGESSGTGLGLAIVHGVIKEHEGYIDVSSSAAAGTAFTLYFPRKDAALHPQVSHAALARGSARILVVDDEVLQLRTARRILSHLGYDVDTVNSSAAALARFVEVLQQRGGYDLVLIDMHLNEAENGLQLFEAIRKYVADQRAILASGHAPDELTDWTMPDGLGWLGKPYTAEALASAVDAALPSEKGVLSKRPSFRVGR